MSPETKKGVYNASTIGNGIAAFVRELINAKGISNHVAVGRIDDNRGFHRFASRRSQAISDCRRVSLLVKTLQTQHGGDSDCRKGDPLRELIRVAKSNRLWIDDTDIAFFGEVLFKRTGESPFTGTPPNATISVAKTVAVLMLL